MKLMLLPELGLLFNNITGCVSHGLSFALNAVELVGCWPADMCPTVLISH